MRDQREVFPGLDSGPNGSEGHYFYALEKRPSGPSLYTTVVDDSFDRLTERVTPLIYRASSVPIFPIYL